ncbi:calcium-binding mitochondrial carrier protein [Acrasis kona]|uniref:Calcium-binding mitochondrial carrier protein n=1 Tax=Acrasis kona TaxID=1008807 RepID=A0AAW2YW96_9EUKA
MDNNPFQNCSKIPTTKLCNHMPAGEVPISPVLQVYKEYQTQVQEKYEDKLRNSVPLSEVEKKARNMFLAIDKDKDHSIGVGDMALYLRENGIFFSRSDFQAFMRRYDRDNSGSLDWLEFWEFVKEQENQIRRVFMQIDVNKSGELEENEFFTALHRLGIPATRAQVHEWTSQISHDPQKRTITYLEWYEYLHTHQFFGESLAHISLDELWEDWKIRKATSIIIDVDDEILLEDDDDEPFNWTHPKWKYMVGGAIAASISRTLTAPLDRLRCLLQVQTMKHAMSTMDSKDFKFKTSWEILKEMGATSTGEKWTTRLKGYYRGNLIAVAKIAPEIAIRNFFFEHLKGAFVKLDPETDKTMDLEWRHRFIAISASAVAAQALLYPLEYIKTALQMSHKQRTVNDIIQAEYQCKMGLRHMFKGLSPSLIRVAGDISVYETLKKIHYERNKAHEDPENRYPSVGELLVMGSMACAVAQSVSYPLLFVRTVMQAQACKDVKPGGKPIVPFNGTIDAFKQIIKREGVRGLYTGWGVNLLKTVPSVTTTFVAYDLLKRSMGIYY